MLDLRGAWQGEPAAAVACCVGQGLLQASKLLLLLLLLLHGGLEVVWQVWRWCAGVQGCVAGDTQHCMAGPRCRAGCSASRPWRQLGQPALTADTSSLATYSWPLWQASCTASLLLMTSHMRPPASGPRQCSTALSCCS